MNCIVRAALKVAVGGLAMTAAAGAWAQATFARGEAIWNTTNVAVPGTAECRGCHDSNLALLPTIRVRYATLTQADVRTRIDQAFAGNVGGNGNATGMAAVYPAMTIGAIDRDALAIFLGNFIGIPSTAATPTALNALTAAVGSPGTTTLTITNSGRSPLTFAAMSGFAFTGANASEFSRASVGTGCDMQTIAAGAPCSETIRFTPSSGASGTRTATLTITHNGSPTTTVLALSGTVSTTPPPGGGGLPAGGGSGGGAVWPWALLLIAAAAFKRRRPR